MTPRTDRDLLNYPAPGNITPLTLHLYFCVPADFLKQPDPCPGRVRSAAACHFRTLAARPRAAAAIDLMHDELEVLVREMLVREEQKK